MVKENVVEIPATILKYWVDLAHEEFLDNPTKGMRALYNSLMGVWMKHVKSV